MRLLGVLITLLVVVVAGYGGVKFMDSVGPDLHDASASSSASVTQVEAGSDKSLVEPENFGKVLAKIKDRFGAEVRVVNLRLEPSRVDVQIPQGEKSVVLQYNSDAETTTDVTTDTDLRDNPNQASILRIPADAPKRIVKKMVSKSGEPETAFEWMTITTFGAGQGVGWLAMLSKGEQTSWRAELNGRKVRAQ